MKTKFTDIQLADPKLAEANQILRSCVHCGFCTATCPTYVLLGDELDSPRGRIYLIKGMLEEGRPPEPALVRHIDRCLSCLSCMTTCPSGVHYQHLIDQARDHIHRTWRRPAAERWLRIVLGKILVCPRSFRAALIVGWLTKPLARMVAGWVPGRTGRRLSAMLGLVPSTLSGAGWADRPGLFPAHGPRRARVALLAGCAQQVLAPAINEAAIRLLTRHGVEVEVAHGAGCCGAIVHHMGWGEDARRLAARNVDAWMRVIDRNDVDAVIVTASGCGTQLKDYGHLLADDPERAAQAARIALIARDVTEILASLPPLRPARWVHQTIAYHAACSLQHGQKVTEAPRALLESVGFTVRLPEEGYMCCGSAGTYNVLEPEIAERLQARKISHLAALNADAVAAGNIGCLSQIGTGAGMPSVHTVELLDWATGGPLPDCLARSPAFIDD